MCFVSWGKIITVLRKSNAIQSALNLRRVRRLWFFGVLPWRVRHMVLVGIYPWVRDGQRPISPSVNIINPSVVSKMSLAG